MQMNWLSRFLHIKPASRTLCFQIGRGKVRQDLVRLLRDWQRFGIQDVTLDRDSNSINARVDKSNRKYSPLLRSRLVFSKWFLQGWHFEIEVLEADYVLRCNAASVFVSSSLMEIELTLPVVDLKIKPVTFVIELFVVLEHGRRANLCLARFTQTRGAASSFRKVVDIVEDVCRARCMLVEDEEKKASMMEVLD
jgi:serine/threonine-protein kinase HSL1 (negative regulator of Swe1 kinase)